VSNRAPLLEKEDLTALAAEFGVGKPAASSGVVRRRGNRRYVIDTPKGHFELRLRSMEEEFDLRREIDLLTFLEKHDFASPRVIADERGRPFIERDGFCLVLIKLPAGNYLDEDDLSLSQVNSAGKIIADLHMLGRGYKRTVENRYGFDRIFELYAHVRRRMPSYLRKIVRTLDEETEYLGNYLETKLPKGIIHGTIHKDALLFKGDSVVCIGDLDAACRGKYVYDLATAVNALCFTSSGYSLERFEALMAGYESVRTLSLAEWDSFPNELRFAALRFAVIRLTEFFASEREEAERINEDFRLFFDRLRVLRREKEGGMEGLLMAMATGYDYRKYQRIKGGEEGEDAEEGEYEPGDEPLEDGEDED
jgi:homoserine kinase type II